MENVFLCIIYVSSLHVIFPRFSPWCSFRDGKIEIRILICWNMLEPLIFLLNTSSLFCLHMFIQVIRLLQMFRPPFQLNPWTFPHSPPFLLTKSVSNPMDVSCFSSLSQDFPENPMGFQNFTSNFPPIFPDFPHFFTPFFRSLLVAREPMGIKGSTASAQLRPPEMDWKSVKVEDLRTGLDYVHC